MKWTLYKIIKWLYARYIDEVYIPKNREVSVLVERKGCCGNQNNNNIQIRYERGKDKQLNKNSGERYIFGFWNEIKIWDKDGIH